MGGHPPHGQGPGGFLGPYCAASNGAAPVAENRQEVGANLGGNNKGGSGFLDNGGVYLEKSEHGRAVHCYSIASGTV